MHMLMKATLPQPPAAAVGAAGCLVCQVRAQALFSVLPPEQLADAAAHVAHARFRPGEPLYQQGQVGAGPLTIRHGIVRFERTSSDGERRIVRLAGPGALIGQEALLQQAFAEDAVACTPVAACRLPRAEVEAFGQRHPAMLRELMRRWQAALDASGEWAAEVTRGSAQRRVLKLLEQLDRLRGEGQSVWLPSRREMQDMLGIAPETASRAISALRRRGVLEDVLPGSARLHRPALQAALQQADR
jgi:CRP-like cAMP-binding protein